MFDPSVFLELETYDPRNPLVAYVYLVVIVMFIRFNLVLTPLVKIYSRFSNKGMISLLRQIKRQANISGIEGYILSQLMAFLVPISIVLLFRYMILGDVPVIEWIPNQIIATVLLGTIWMVIEIRGTIQTRKALEPFGAPLWQDGIGWNPKKWFGTKEERRSTFVDPKVLEGVLWSRQKLVEFSQWHIDYLDSGSLIDESLSEESIFYKNDEEKWLIDGDILKGKATNIAIKSSAAAKNVQSAIYAGIKAVSGKTVKKFDESLQNEVNKIVQPKTTQIALSYLYKCVMVFGPIYYIYVILPLMS